MIQNLNENKENENRRKRKELELLGSKELTLTAWNFNLNSKKNLMLISGRNSNEVKLESPFFASENLDLDFEEVFNSKGNT